MNASHVKKVDFNTKWKILKQALLNVYCAIVILSCWAKQKEAIPNKLNPTTTFPIAATYVYGKNIIPALTNVMNLYRHAGMLINS